MLLRILLGRDLELEALLRAARRALDHDRGAAGRRTEDVYKRQLLLGSYAIPGSWSGRLRAAWWMRVLTDPGHSTCLLYTSRCV